MYELYFFMLGTALGVFFSVVFFIFDCKTLGNLMVDKSIPDYPRYFVTLEKGGLKKMPKSGKFIKLKIKDVNLHDRQKISDSNEV